MSTDPSSEIIRVQFAFTYAEFMRINMGVILRRFRWLILFAVLTTLPFFAVLLFSTESKSATEPGQLLLIAVLAFAPPLFVGLILLLNYLAIRGAWRSNPMLRGQFSYEFSQNGCSSQSPLGDSFVGWECIKIVKQIGTVVLLQASRTVFHGIPVRAFRDRAQWDDFRRLVQSHVRGSRLRSADPTIFAAEPTSAGPGDLNPGVVLAAPTPAVAQSDAFEEIAIHIRHTPTLRRYLGIRLPITLILLIVILVAGGVMVVVPDLKSGEQLDVDELFIRLAIVALIALVFSSLNLLPPLLMWLMSSELREPRTYIISDEGVETIAQSFTGRVLWSGIDNVQRQGPSMVLCSGRLQAVTLPTDAFTKDQWQEFCDVLKRKVTRLSPAVQKMVTAGLERGTQLS
jgi:hypothetical protein